MHVDLKLQLLFSFISLSQNTLLPFIVVILNNYQEQPHLLDPHLGKCVSVRLFIQNWIMPAFTYQILVSLGDINRFPDSTSWLLIIKTFFSSVTHCNIWYYKNCSLSHFELKKVNMWATDQLFHNYSETHPLFFKS